MPDDYQEFTTRLNALFEKLSADEREMLSMIMDGAEIQHTVWYVFGSFVLGAAAGAMATMLAV